MIEIIDLSQYIGPELDKKKAKLEKAKSKLLELEKKADIEENTRVTAVESVMQALVFLDSEHDVNMIVSDYCMPEMTGYDLLMASEERIRKCFDGGAKDYILKPVKIADVPRILNYI
ncbi:hypothetical protein OsI_28947 [Oryza sativa Indica Group]|uniref:Response regulatory domain-containing protein n=1 Tax=Oryza sativa subsp. indica TaxID=39946 RepID=A2YUD9_ORYSI|nr:hypothetical protein OsI_28947 [Oryza sativa Indica Group]